MKHKETMKNVDKNCHQKRKQRLFIKAFSLFKKVSKDAFSYFLGLVIKAKRKKLRNLF